MGKYAPAREDGLLPYVVTTIEWAGSRRYDKIKWAENLADAKRRYGWTGMLHTRMEVRRARVEDMPKVSGGALMPTYLRCAGCGRTFAAPEAHAAHRVGGDDERACADPATIRRHDRDGNDLGPLLELNRWYAWRIRPTEAQRAAHEAFLARVTDGSPADMPLEAHRDGPISAVRDQEAS